MNSVILTKTYKQPPYCEKEILRYAGCKTTDHAISVLMKSCIDEMQGKFVYKVCYREFFVKIKGDICDFGAFKVCSENLASNLRECGEVILFAATVGLEADRLISKYGRTSPSKALMIQAIGAERIEALCDAFCEEMAREKKCDLKPRFSPGYGDLPLDVQKDIFAVLECPKQIGLFLNDSLLMSPSKSVTAFIGLVERSEK